jgi:hypothetical protein
MESELADWANPQRPKVLSRVKKPCLGLETMHLGALSTHKERLQVPILCLPQN